MKFISITPENNNAADFLKITNQMPSFVKLYSPNCGHCTAMQGAWDEMANKPELKCYNMAIIEVHADVLDKINSPAMTVNEGFPTIRKVLKNGKPAKDYNGNRSTQDMLNFIQQEFKETKSKTHKKRKLRRKVRRTLKKRSRMRRK